MTPQSLSEIREENFSGSIIGAIREYHLEVVLSITVKKCPYCGTWLDAYSGSESPLGSNGNSRCMKCGGVINNGNKEWQMFSQFEKAFHYFRLIFTFITTGSVFTFIGFRLLFGDVFFSEISMLTLIQILGVGIPCFFSVYFLFIKGHLDELKASKRRSE
jgi:hypothetical protein